MPPRRKLHLAFARGWQYTITSIPASLADEMVYCHSGHTEERVQRAGGAVLLLSPAPDSWRQLQPPPPRGWGHPRPRPPPPPPAHRPRPAPPPHAPRLHVRGAGTPPGPAGPAVAPPAAAPSSPPRPGDCASPDEERLPVASV